MLNKEQEGLLLNSPQGPKWEKIGLNRRAGIVLPLFSVYSKDSAGIGDLEDLRGGIDFCVKTSNSILQLLPMNDMGETFCPYDSVSSFAIDPVYLSLKKIAKQEDLNKIKTDFPAGRRNVDYGVKSAKISALWNVFTANKEAEIACYIEENSYWIDDFALFKALKDYHKGKPWYEWPREYRNREKKTLDEFSRAHKKAIFFQVWLQWLLYKQFTAARKYANENGVFLKGDMPLFVSRDSADVWAHPEFFKLDFAAGAPPDMYCARGQRWGMPTYNWQSLSSQGYKYWKEKLKYAQNFYSLLRIDHAVGLFRTWSIPYEEPLENQGLNGSFDIQDEALWENRGKEILSLLVNNTNMLFCAEDLGIIPRVCPKVLYEMGILGNDVQRWIKGWNTTHNFLEPGEYRFLSVAMLSTHDTTTWAGWWENEAGTIDEGLFKRICAQKEINYSQLKDKLFNNLFSRHGRLRWLDSVSTFLAFADIIGKDKGQIQDLSGIYEDSFKEKEKLWEYLNMPGVMKEKADKPLIKAVLKSTLDSNAIFCIQLVTDWLNLTDLYKEDTYLQRVNTPGTVSPQNWSLTIPLVLEDLLNSPVCQQIKEMVVSSFRG